METLQLLIDYASVTDNVYLQHQLNKLKKEINEYTETLQQ